MELSPEVHSFSTQIECRYLLHVPAEGRCRVAVFALHGYGMDPETMLLLGFSQPVGLNYRFVGTFPDQVGAVIGMCGGVPRDWEEAKYRSFSNPVLHLAREEDEYYPVETARDFPNRLRRHAQNIEFHLLPGKHRFPSKAGEVVTPWLHRVFGEQCRPMLH